jgi:hypothetical protein
MKTITEKMSGKIYFNKEEIVETFLGILVLLGILFMAFLLVLWAILPFAVFGIKKRLDRVIELLEKDQIIEIEMPE